MDFNLCCIQSNGHSVYCAVLGVAVYASPHPLYTPLPDSDGQYRATTIFYQEGTSLKAISALDIESIVVFDDKFQVRQTITPCEE